MQPIIQALQQFWINLQHGQLPQLGHWTYIVLAVLIVWQGPVATILGGAAASAGLLKPQFVFLAGITGNLTADILWYTVGRRSHFERVFTFLRLKKYTAYLNVVKEGMNRHAQKLLLLSKLSFGLAVPTLVAAGMSGLSWRKWFPIVFLGETIWTGTLVVIGYFATEAIKQVEYGIQLFLILMSAALIILLIWYISRVAKGHSTVRISSLEEEKNSKI